MSTFSASPALSDTASTEPSSGFALNGQTAASLPQILTQLCTAWTTRPESGFVHTGRRTPSLLTITKHVAAELARRFPELPTDALPADRIYGYARGDAQPPPARRAAIVCLDVMTGANGRLVRAYDALPPFSLKYQRMLDSCLFASPALAAEVAAITALEPPAPPKDEHSTSSRRNPVSFIVRSFAGYCCAPVKKGGAGLPASDVSAELMVLPPLLRGFFSFQKRRGAYASALKVLNGIKRLLRDGGWIDGRGTAIAARPAIAAALTQAAAADPSALPLTLACKRLRRVAAADLAPILVACGRLVANRPNLEQQAADDFRHEHDHPLQFCCERFTAELAHLGPCPLTGRRKWAVAVRELTVTAFAAFHGFTIDTLYGFQQGEMKPGAPGHIEFDRPQLDDRPAQRGPLPSPMAELFRLYHDQARPELMRDRPWDPALFVSLDGTRLSSHGLMKDLRGVTKRVFGRSFGVHALRHILFVALDGAGVPTHEIAALGGVSEKYLLREHLGKRTDRDPQRDRRLHGELP